MMQGDGVACGRSFPIRTDHPHLTEILKALCERSQPSSMNAVVVGYEDTRLSHGLGGSESRPGEGGTPSVEL